MFSLLTLFLVAISLLSCSEAARLNPRTVSELRYSRAHSLGDNYQFEARNGWESVNITDLQYKYASSIEESGSTATEEGSLEARSGKKKPNIPLGISNTVKHTLDQVWKGLKGIGQLEKVKITWFVDFGSFFLLWFLFWFRYTGQDLENPSCWSQSGWAPSVS